MLKIIILITSFFTSAFANNVSEPFCKNLDSKILDCFCRTIQIRCRGGSNSSYDEAWKLFETVPNLIELSFFSNFNFLPTQMLAVLPNLQEYSCAMTNISQVPKYSFNNLYKLRTIDLSYNKLTSIDGHAFNNLPNLKRILLYSNKIKTIDENAFIAVPKLSALGLAKNNIEELPNVLRSLKSLNELDLRFNNIKTFNYELLASMSQNFLSGISEFFISNNALVCDCNLRWVANLFEKTQSESTKRYALETNCTLSDGSWIKLVDYDFMKICVPDELKTTTIVPSTTTYVPIINTIPIISPKTITIKSMNETTLNDILKLIPEEKIILNVKEIIFHNPVINFIYNYNNGTAERTLTAAHN